MFTKDDDNSKHIIVKINTEMTNEYYWPMKAESVMMCAEAAPERFKQIQNITLPFQGQARFGIK
jgi:hypothetical protein